MIENATTLYVIGPSRLLVLTCLCFLLSPQGLPVSGNIFQIILVLKNCIASISVPFRAVACSG